MKVIIFYLVFLNGMLLAQLGPYPPGYPNGQALNMIHNWSHSDSTPEQKRRIEERRRAEQEAASRSIRDTGVDIADIMQSFLELQKNQSKKQNIQVQKASTTKAINQINDCQATINQLLKQKFSQKDKEIFSKLDCYQKNKEDKILSEIIKERQDKEIKSQKNKLNQQYNALDILEQNKKSITVTNPIEKKIDTESIRNRNLDANDICEKEKISMLEKANSQYEIQLIKSLECQKSNINKKYKNFMGEFDTLGDYWFNMIFGTLSFVFFGGLVVTLILFWIRDIHDNNFPMNGA